MPTPLAKKMGIKSGQRLLVIDAPQAFLDALAPLPEDSSLQTEGQGPFDGVVAFVSNQADVDTSAPRALQALKPGGLLWFSYPKKSSGVKTDISRDTGWHPLQAAGFRPVTQIAMDDTWSALRFRPEHEVTSRPRTT